MVLLGASTRIGHSQARSRITSYSAGSAVLEDGTGRPLKRLVSREIVLRVLISA